MARGVQEIVGAHGRIAVLVNPLDVDPGPTPIEDMDSRKWDYVMATNAKSAFLHCRHVLGVMRLRGQGKILNLAGAAALRGEAGHVAYSAAKAAVVRLTEALAEEVRGQGVSVNCIMPATPSPTYGAGGEPRKDLRNRVLA